MSTGLIEDHLLHDGLSFIINVDITLAHHIPYIRWSNITILLYLNLSKL